MVLGTGNAELELDPTNTFADIFVKNWLSSGRADAVAATVGTISRETCVTFEKLLFAGRANVVWLVLSSTFVSIESITTEVLGVPANKNKA